MSDIHNNSLAYGPYKNFVFNPQTSSFGALEVPSGMRPVSSFRGSSKPLLTMPYGPGGQWLAGSHEGAASSGEAMFGSSVSDHNVTQSGYLSLWDAQPRSLPPSWNPLLLQGGNVYKQRDNSPLLSSVVPVSSFGRVRRVSKVTKAKNVKSAVKKTKANTKTKKKTNTKAKRQ